MEALTNWLLNGQEVAWGNFLLIAIAPVTLRNLKYPLSHIPAMSVRINEPGQASHKSGGHSDERAQRRRGGAKAVSTVTMRNMVSPEPLPRSRTVPYLPKPPFSSH